MNRDKSPEGILSGDVFGDLTVIGMYGRNRRYQCIWAVKCVCGRLKPVLGTNLKRGDSTSCGAHRKHGEAKYEVRTKEYVAWLAMINRCSSNRPDLRRCYKDRGISVCGRWRKSFENFLEDVGRKPSDKHSLDRIDNGKGYSPGNVRWADKRTQARNRRGLRYLTISGITKLEIEWAEISGISLTTIRSRSNRGWKPEEIISKVMGKHRVGRCG